MNEIEFDHKVIEDKFHVAEKKLFDSNNVIPVIYKDFDCTTFDLNNKSILDGIAGKAIVYCIWVAETPNSFSPKYIGHAGKTVSRQRIRNHLSIKNPKTGAKLNNVKIELGKRNSIGITYLKVEPDYMRKSLEDWLISNHSNLLEWNFIGKRKILSKTLL
jgi:hypothetical protein